MARLSTASWWCTSNSKFVIYCKLFSYWSSRSCYVCVSINYSLNPHLIFMLPSSSLLALSLLSLKSFSTHSEITLRAFRVHSWNRLNNWWFCNTIFTHIHYLGSDQCLYFAMRTVFKYSKRKWFNNKHTSGWLDRYEKNVCIATSTNMKMLYWWTIVGRNYA